MKDLEKKTKNPYAVKSMTKGVMDVDMTKRTVTGLFNSYFYIDSDRDMLLPNCAAKSIASRGVGSTEGNKIKHLKDHDWAKVVARLDVLDERKVSINGKELEGIYHESWYSTAMDSSNQLIKIQEGLYDDRSIGFSYVQIELADLEGDKKEVANWHKYYPMALNPEKADEAGYFYIVPEIHLMEGSDVAFGANSLTPMIEIKSAGDKVAAIDRLNGKLDIMTSLFKKGNLSDDGFYQLEMETKQIKSYISTLITEQKTITAKPERKKSNNNNLRFIM